MNKLKQLDEQIWNGLENTLWAQMFNELDEELFEDIRELIGYDEFWHKELDIPHMLKMDLYEQTFETVRISAWRSALGSA